MGTSPDSQYRSTAGLILASLKCHYIVEAAESIKEGLLAMVQTFATGPKHLNAGMVIIEQRDQPPMEPMHNGSYHRTPPVGVRMSQIIPISMIEGAVHHHPLTLQPDSMPWYLSNLIDLNALNLVYVLIIRLDAWSNHCSDISKSAVCLLWVL